jgi:tetratricopeptide (TPR) repeat protein
VTVRLGGLAVEEVEALVGVEQAAVLHARTAGNPFFVRALMAGGDVRSGSVDAAVRRRVAQLGEDDQEVLRTAAVAGLEFDIAVVAAALGRSVEDVVSAVEAAADAALVDDVTVNRHRFAHEIVRDNLVAQLSATRRALALQRLADGYERVAPELLSRLAHHRAEAAIDAESRRLAVRCLIAAGDAAEAVFDHDEAIRAYTRARALATGASSGEMAHLLLSLGTALVASGSRSDDTAGILAEALEHAVDADLRDVVENAWYRVANLTSSRGTVVPPFPPDARAVADPAVIARGASLETFYRYRQSMVGAGARPALDDVERIRDEVRRHGDDRAIGLIEAVYGYVLPAARARERRAALCEARERYIRGFDDPLSALIITGTYIDALLASGDVDGAVDEIATLRHDADRRRDRFLQHWGAAAMSTVALLRGHLDVAESHADDAVRLAGTIDGLDFSGQHGVQMFSIRREQGRLHEIAPVLRTLVRLDPTMAGAWRPGLAAAYAELEMVAEAAAELDRIVTEDAVDLPDDERLVLSASYLADAAVALEDRVRAAPLYELFRSWHDINVTLELIACYGPAQRYLGMLAFTLGDLDAATTHLSDALRRCHAMGARTYEAHTHYWLGRVAQQDGRPDRASHHLRHALDLATTIGMHALARRARHALG